MNNTPPKALVATVIIILILFTFMAIAYPKDKITIVTTGATRSESIQNAYKAKNAATKKSTSIYKLDTRQTQSGNYQTIIIYKENK